MKQSTDKLKVVDKVEKNIKYVLVNLKITRQTALIEHVEDKLSVIRAEAFLLQNKFDKYLTENNIVEFYKKFKIQCGETEENSKYLKTHMSKALRLTWIKNYTRIIPNDVIDIKKKTDALKVFDNYVVLHFNSLNESVNDTKEEIREKAKDPILFGVIKDSSKLYYVGDWVDEYCDLTLDKLLEEINLKEVNKLNTENITNNG